MKENWQNHLIKNNSFYKEEKLSEEKKYFILYILENENHYRKVFCC